MTVNPWDSEEAQVGDEARAVPGSVSDTDVGNAYRFKAQFDGRVLYCKSWGQWLDWTGTHWRKDDVGRAELGVYRLAQVMRAEAEEVPEGSPARKALTRNLLYLESDMGVARCLRRSAPLLPSLPTEFDTDPDLFNTLSGTIDLRTGQNLGHRAADRITKLSQLFYSPGSRCPRWDAFLEEMQPDPEIRRFLQQYVGYALTGHVYEQYLPINWGDGSNGKTVFAETIQRVMGDYAQMAPEGLLVVNRNEQHPTGLADLAGTRFVVGAELAGALNEALVKNLTGGDTIKARKMRQDFFKFAPTHKFLVHTNKRLVIRGTDLGIWRRVLLIPWTVTIPQERWNTKLREQLVTAEAPGILNWCIAGSMDWREHGLIIPESIRVATKEYQEESNMLKRFLDERTVIDTKERGVTVGQLYEAYEDWARDSGEAQFKLTKRVVSEEMTHMGYQQRKSGDVRYWADLRICPNVETDLGAETPSDLEF